MKFRAHDTFAIRKGWLHKGMRYVFKNPRIFVDKSINQMDELGIGANMVKALRYWLQACGLTVETGSTTRSQEFTPFGELVWENDTYMEEDGTLYLLHYMLASNIELATAWYYFFNLYSMTDITKESFINDIKSYISGNNPEPISLRTLEDDFDCIVKTYLSNDNKNNPENNTDCPFNELKLLSSQEKKNKIYTKSAPTAGSINPLIILAVIINEKEKNHCDNEIKISKLEKDENNVGKIFNLDNMQIAYYLDKLQNLGYLRVVRAAGLDIINLKTRLSFTECVKAYYESLSS